MSELTPWSTTAINLPEHSDNIIHTDAGARAAGFDRALVAGTTVYAYMTHPVVDAWGADWLAGGGCELRLRRPVFDTDLVECLISSSDGGPVVTATVDGDARASIEVWRQAEAPSIRQGEELRPLEITLSEDQLTYGMRAGDDLTIYAERDIIPPVTWANLANTVFKDNLVTGPWIHVRSKIYHQGMAASGAQVRVDAWLVDRFDSRAGERALVDMLVSADGVPVATIEHEAIITLPGETTDA